MAAVQWLTRTGQISNEKREEFILASDVLGLSMLVVQMNHRLDPAATPATVLGPFHIEGSPEVGFGGDMSEGLAGVPLYVHGTVREDRKSTRLNSSHANISYAVFCLKTKQ